MYLIVIVSVCYRSTVYLLFNVFKTIVMVSPSTIGSVLNEFKSIWDIIFCFCALGVYACFVIIIIIAVCARVHVFVQ